MSVINVTFSDACDSLRIAIGSSAEEVLRKSSFNLREGLTFLINREYVGM